MRWPSVQLAIVIVLLALPGSAAAAGFSFCVGQNGGGLAPRCGHKFLIHSPDSGDIYAAFRADRPHLYQISVDRGLGTGVLRYRPRYSHGKLIWDLYSLQLRDPGAYRVRLYFWNGQRSHLVATRRIRVHEPPSLPGNALPISAEVKHIFAPPPNGYDQDGNGLIEFRKSEWARTDAKFRSWDPSRFFLKVHKEKMAPNDLRAWLGKFDANHDGRLKMIRTRLGPSGEFAKACAAVWGNAEACPLVTLTAFEKRLPD